MRKNFVELYNQWKDLNVAFWHASDFASYLDAQGIKPKKSRWIPFTATADSVCPVDGDTLVKVRLTDGEESSDYVKAEILIWSTNSLQQSDYIIAYKVKKEEKKKWTI